MDRRSLVVIAALSSLVPMTFGAAMLSSDTLPSATFVDGTVPAIARPAPPDATPPGQVMEKVDGLHETITGMLWISKHYDADRQRIADGAWVLIDLNASTRNHTQTALDLDRPQADWTEQVDAFDEAAKRFVRVVLKPGTFRDEAQSAYAQVAARCTACHDVFHPAVPE